MSPSRCPAPPPPARDVVGMLRDSVEGRRLVGTREKAEESAFFIIDELRRACEGEWGGGVRPMTGEGGAEGAGVSLPSEGSTLSLAESERNKKTARAWRTRSARRKQASVTTQAYMGRATRRHQSR